LTEKVDCDVESRFFFFDEEITDCLLAIAPVPVNLESSLARSLDFDGEGRIAKVD
jgi:hypothetical protein